MRPEAKELLRLSNASFGYAGEVIVKDASFVVHEGDLLGVIGPNGSGKTTLLRGLLGLIPPLSGEVKRATASLGYVPQRETLDGLFPLTVREVVEMSFRGRPRGQRRIRNQDRELCDSLLDRVGLLAKSGNSFSSLSGGQRQRVLIARALVLEPSLLLLDEPTSGVDHEANKSVVRILRDLNSDGIAILIVSHHLNLVRNETNRVLRVVAGKVEELASQELSESDPFFGSSEQGAAKPVSS